MSNRVPCSAFLTRPPNQFYLFAASGLAKLSSLQVENTNAVAKPAGRQYYLFLEGLLFRGRKAMKVTDLEPVWCSG